MAAGFTDSVLVFPCVQQLEHEGIDWTAFHIEIKNVNWFTCVSHKSKCHKFK